MSGLLAVVARGPEPLDHSAWGRACVTAKRFGETVDARQGTRAAIAAWRRDSGELPLSGTIAGTGRGSRVSAWVGFDRRVGTRSTLLQDLHATDHDALATRDGEWSAATVDLAAGTLRASTDRWSHRPLHVHVSDRVVAVSTDWRVLISFVDRPRLSADSLAMFLTIGELIDDTSPVAGLRVLPAATMLDEGGAETTWWRHRIHESNRSAADLAERWATTLDASIRACPPGPESFVVPVSGGLDSRVLLDLASRRTTAITATTWGEPGCRDIRYAARLAHACRVRHVARAVDPEEHPKHWMTAVDRTAGAFGVCDMHVAPFTDATADLAPLMLNGLAGDIVLGGNFIQSRWLAMRNPSTLAEDVWRWRGGTSNHDVLRPLIGTAAIDQAGERWTSSLVAYIGDDRPAAGLHAWLTRNRIFRWTNCGTEIFRRRVESFSPFFANDVVDLLESTPLEARRRHRLYFRVLDRLGGASSRVPWDRTALPPRLGWPAAVGSMAVHRLVKKLLGGLPGPRTARGPAWMDGPWRPHVESLLRNARLADEGLVRQEGVDRALTLHGRDGRDLSQLLGRLVSAELLQRLIDESCGSSLAASADQDGTETLRLSDAEKS